MKNEKNTHGLLNNLKFMLHEQWVFEKKATVIPFIRILSDLAVALMGIWLPKVVLDAISQSIPVHVFLTQIGLLTVALMLLKYISYYSEQGVLKNAVRIWNVHFYIKKDWKILDMDYSIFTSPKGKILIEKAHDSLSRNVNVNMASFYPKLVELVRSVLGLLSFCAVIAFLNPIIILLLLISYGIDGLISLNIQKWEHSIKDKRATIDRKLYYVFDSTNNSSIAKDIRLYDMKSWINHAAKSFMNEKNTLEKQVETKHLLQRLFEAFLIFIRNGGGYIYLIWKMLHTDMTVGEFTLYFGAISGFGLWLHQIVRTINGLSNASCKVDDYRNLMDTKDKLMRSEGEQIPALNEPVEIVLENVRFHYEGSDQTIVDDINLTISKGERLAIVGVNGAGKTTLIKLICGLLEPVSGRVLMNGMDIRRFNREAYYSLITAAFQNVCVLPMSIAQNITFKDESDIDTEKLEKCVELANLKEKMDRLPKRYSTQLVPSVVDDGVNLSGGELQKLMLARALYKDAPLIILDEPTAALDPIAENQMYLRYSELTNNKTAIYISHRLSSTRFCDRIIFVEHGKIIETGTHDELLARGGKYKAMFDVQSQYYKDYIEEKAI
ncbi:ABC transporter ATP-binding protein [Paenibacillus mendelii]|uniref:ABC transporter ATP-binding protein n=1 Tax=Paenibacillus mendelii TaxID=206163 RepID=A0ABV6JB50_9BACL|nr:ABC transporter ATP-binding protein [Paenibacillus mendelii]MCQ6564024.1 ABC transporter ATP-binding protein/permease [Paenibacillus mendelii]